MKRLIPILLLMFFSAPVMAVEPITGAFGLKLGDVWDGEAITTSEEDDQFVHLFIPDLPHDLFDFYAIQVTPVKKLIFTIIGRKKGECEQQQYQDLKKALIKKYGAGMEGDEAGHLWRQGKRKREHPDEYPNYTYAKHVLIQCEENGLFIYYVDLDIYDSRADELLPDTSNL